LDGFEYAAAPLIGLSTYRENAKAGVWENDFALLQQAYVESLTDAGAAVVLLPPQPPAAAGNLVAHLDALVLTGGADVSPQLYGGLPQEPSALRPERDAWEIALLAAARERDIPVLGICRGLQVINVALGGTLEQHVPDRVGHDGHRPVPGQFGSVVVSVVPGSLLAGLVGERLSVPCHHHQAVAGLARDLRLVASAADRTVEAAEDPTRDFFLGVQWPPEQDRTDLRLFTGLVQAARRRPERS
jgi:gamma-glutamyl-gamma-aminobutyrate hydrolase PuuD